MKASIEVLPEHHNQKLSAAFINCLWFQSSVPESITIQVTDSTAVGAPVTIDVQNTRYASISETFGLNQPIVCVRPLFGPYSDTRSLIEFISYYSINGINNFIFFNYSIAPSVLKLLSSLTSVNIVILPWSLSPSIARNIHEIGQLASVHFCIKAFPLNPIVVVDIDEFMVVRGTVDEFPKGVASEFPKGTVSESQPEEESLSNYIFRTMASDPNLAAEIVPMVLVCYQNNPTRSKTTRPPRDRFSSSVKSFDPNSSTTGVMQNLGTSINSTLNVNISPSSIVSKFRIMNSVRRQATFWPYGIRSKQLIFRPYLIKSLGIHTIDQLKYPSSSSYKYSHQVAVFHHRSCCGLTQFYTSWLPLLVLSYDSLADDIITDFSISNSINYEKLINFIKIQSNEVIEQFS